ncbi:hypothetical protein AB0J57_16160 [Streptomyces sp. NPDC049837]|uniref:hypothetical protein n=1 Tax=Streptomyces sp. NPDC049837 TaxID=3155277 RepID=UPI00342AA5E7
MLAFLAVVHGHTFGYQCEPTRQARASGAGMRSWVARAPADLLLHIAEVGREVADRVARQQGFAGQGLPHADAEGLKATFTALPPSLACLALHWYALTDENPPERQCVMEHWGTLWQAATTPAPWPEPPKTRRRSAKAGTGPAGTAPASPEAQHSTRSQLADRENLVSDDLAEQLVAAAHRLRREGEALAGRLESLATDIRRGVGTRDSQVTAAVDAWFGRRAETAELALRLGGDTRWTDEQTHDDLDRMLAGVRAAKVREEIEKAVADRAGLVTMLAGTSNPGVLSGLQAAIVAIDTRLAELRSIDGLPPEPRQAGPLTGEPPAPDTPEPLPEAAGAHTLPAAAGASVAEEAGSGGEETEPAADARVTDPEETEPAADARVTEPEEAPPAAAPSTVPAARTVNGPESRLGQTGGALPQPRTAPRQPVAPQAALPPDVRQAAVPPDVPQAALSPDLPQQRPDEDEREATDAVGAATAVGSTDIWTRTGDHPSPMETLIAAGRLAEAYWLSRAAGEREERCQSLAFAASAFGLAPGQQAAMTLQLNVEEECGPLPTAEDRDGYLIALAAAVRSGLQAGWALPIVNDFAQLPGLPEVWNELFRTLAQETRRGVSVQPGEEFSLGQDDTVDPMDLGDRAEALKRRLPTSKIAYQLASRVLQTLLKDDAELGRTLNLITAWSVGGATPEQLRQDLESTYGGHDSVDRIIRDTTRRVSSPNQRKTKIIATALDQLRGRIGEVTMLLREAVQVAEMPPRGDSRRLRSELVDAVRAALQAAPLPGPGGEAVRLLLNWINTGSSPVPPGSVRGLPSTDSLLVLPGLTWTTTAAGQDIPDLSAADTLDALLELTDPVDTGKAFAAHVDRGDLHLAGRLVELVETGRHRAVSTPEAGQADTLRRLLGDSEAEWRVKADAALRQAADLFAQVRLQNLLTPGQESHLAAQLLDLENSGNDLRFRRRLEQVREVVAQLSTRVSEKTDQLREQLAGLNLGEVDVARISGLIDRGDVATAEELLSFARKGESIPEQAAETGEEMAAFLEGVRHPDAPKASSTGVSARWWFDHYARGRSGQAETDAVTVALEAWDSLGRPNERRNSFQKHVPSVLRMLGLSVKGPVRLGDQDRKDWQVMTLSITAEISDNVPGYVSRLGSRAGGVYRVLIVANEELGPDALLRHLPEAALGANIILYLQPLGIGGRRRLAQASYQKPQQAIVVDPAVLGWIAAGEARSFRAVQRVTLPWAAYRPYEPFQAGQVSAEVFKGRDDEKSAIMAREGGLFVYGGRQLGKSSLLRQVADSFQVGHGGNQVAVYTDLRIAEIGLSRLPNDIWSVLAHELKVVGVLDHSVSGNAAPATVATRIRQWLDESSDRRILFLADEADAFLNADARPVETAGAQSTFRTLAGLMQLMADTERRFKIVFAGLHQVQRYNRLTNSITGHGGEPVLVGPLRPKAAVDLVVEPLAAVGLFFDNPDLVWRILALTNNQANLVQIVCEGLVEEMQSRALSPDGGRPRITAADVQKVVASGGIRDKIRDRLRLTIDLEDRYRVLTLILALRSLTDGYARGYTPHELQEQAHGVWPDGFPEQNGVDEVRTDLMEMEGLGLVLPLQGRSNSFVMRSPNIVNMLGTRDELHAELRTSEFTQKYDYNPRVARRSIGVDRRQVMRMSPLTDEQWHDALSRRITMITATTALGAGFLEKAAKQHAGEGRQFLSVPMAELAQTVTKWAREHTPHLLFADLRGAPSADVRDAVERLAKYAWASEEDGKEIPRRRTLAVVDPLTASGLDLPEVFRVQPRRWNTTSLRAWPEQPFVSAQERRNLIEATGGWPAFVEQTIARYIQGARREELFETMRVRMDDPGPAADHLQRVGLSERRVRQMAAWADMFSLEEYREGKAHAIPQDLAVVLDDDLDEAESLLTDLEALGVLDDDGEVLTVDSVTFRALHTVARLQDGAV